MAVSRADLAQSHELGRRRGGRARRGPRRCFRRRRRRAVRAAVGHDRAPVPPRSSGSDGRLARPPRRARRATATHLNARAVFGALRFRGPGTDLTVGLPEGHIWVSGASTSRNEITFVPNLPTEEVFTIARPRPRRGHGARDQTAQLRRHADRRLQPALRRRTRRARDGRARRSGAAATRSTPTRRRGGSARSRWCRTARRSRSRAGSSTTRSSTRTPRATSRSARRTSSR